MLMSNWRQQIMRRAATAPNGATTVARLVHVLTVDPDAVTITITIARP